MTLALTTAAQLPHGLQVGGAATTQSASELHAIVVVRFPSYGAPDPGPILGAYTMEATRSLAVCGARASVAGAVDASSSVVSVVCVGEIELSCGRVISERSWDPLVCATTACEGLEQLADTAPTASAMRIQGQRSIGVISHCEPGSGAGQPPNDHGFRRTKRRSKRR